MIIRLFQTVCLLVVLVIAGCGAPKDYALIEKNFAAGPLFRAGKVLPEYKYYYNGPDAEPIALLAVDRRYRLEAKFWTEIDLTDAKLSKWLKEFDRLTGDYDDLAGVRIDYSPLEIFAKDGERVGVIYSRYDWVVAWFGEGKTLTVAPPQASSLQRMPGMGRRGLD